MVEDQLVPSGDEGRVEVLGNRGSRWRAGKTQYEGIRRFLLGTGSPDHGNGRSCRSLDVAGKSTDPRKSITRCRCACCSIGHTNTIRVPVFACTAHQKNRSVQARRWNDPKTKLPRFHRFLGFSRKISPCNADQRDIRCWHGVGQCFVFCCGGQSSCASTKSLR